MLNVEHVGGRNHPVTGDRYNAFEMTSSSDGWDTWPSSPLFPTGHVVYLANGKAYEVVASRTVQKKVPGGGVTYKHSYLCREADPTGL
jgi:hypothetical protein